MADEQPVDRSPSLRLAPAAKRILGQEVADRLREAIIRGQFVAGDYLREEQLASVLDVSRGPVREALALLERENLVAVRRNRGTVVVGLTVADLEEVFSLRMAVEQLAVEWASRNRTDADLEAAETVLDEFVAALQGPITEREAADFDVRFHDTVFRAAHHRRLWASWSAMRAQVQVFLLRRNIANQDWRSQMADGHRAILKAIADRDPVAAADLVEGHLDAAYQRLRASFAEVERISPPPAH
jgi:DNA-binding GntR family transcriptional regulator